MGVRVRRRRVCSVVHGSSLYARRRSRNMSGGFCSCSRYSTFVPLPACVFDVLSIIAGNVGDSQIVSLFGSISLMLIFGDIANQQCRFQVCGLAACGGCCVDISRKVWLNFLT